MSDLVTMSPSMVDGLIIKVETHIINLKHDLQTFKEEMDQISEKYDKALAYNTNLQDFIKREESTLTILAEMKAGKPVRTLKGGSNTLLENKRKANLPWKKLVVDVLTRRSKPAFAIDVIDTIINGNAEFKGMETNKARYYLDELGRNRKQGLRHDSKKRLALEEWFDDDGIIKPQYLML